MKTAISLPDDLFQAAERHRRRQGKSRSQLYAEALSEYLSRHGPDEVTEAMDPSPRSVGTAWFQTPLVGRCCAAGTRAQRVVDLAQGEVWWAELPDPTGSGPGFQRPVVRGPGQLSEPEPGRYCGLRAPDEQLELGGTLPAVPGCPSGPLDFRRTPWRTLRKS